ncbi:hypothetical protein BJ170DRAFT_594822 [Xylariales sp. AK1849]|nr:hypothetical protein BJ170DRAFT_594822 [Xylariales sp. AK1849]
MASLSIPKRPALRWLTEATVGEALSLTIEYKESFAEYIKDLGGAWVAWADELSAQALAKRKSGVLIKIETVTDGKQTPLNVYFRETAIITPVVLDAQKWLCIALGHGTLKISETNLGAQVDHYHRTKLAARPMHNHLHSAAMPEAATQAVFNTKNLMTPVTRQRQSLPLASLILSWKKRV